MTWAFLFHKEDCMVKTRDDYDRNYRKVEAMYWKNYSIDQICANMSHLPRFEVIDMIQKIFGIEMMKRERKQAQYR